MELRDEREQESASASGPARLSPNAILTEYDRRQDELIQLGQIAQQIPLMLAQMQQLHLAAPRRRRWKMLVFPIILIGLSGVASMALPMMLNFAGVKTNSAKTAATESKEFVLNATCVLGDERMAIINGQVYRPKDTVLRPNSSEPPYVIEAIYPNRVVLLGSDGKHTQLAYANHRDSQQNAATTQSTTSDSPQSNGTRPADDASDLNRLLEKAKNGELGVTDLPGILSGLTKRHD